MSDGASGARLRCRVLAAVDGAACVDAPAAQSLVQRLREVRADGVTLAVRGNDSWCAGAVALLVEAAEDLDVVIAPYDMAVARRVSAFRFTDWKVDPPLLTHLPLLEEIAVDGRRVMMGIAGCTRHELVDAMRLLPNGTTLLHTILGRGAIGIADVAHIRALQQYGSPLGYADGSLDSGPALTAVALGAVVVEKQLTLDPTAYAHNDRTYLLPHEFRSLVDEVRQLEHVLAGDGARDPKPEELDGIDQDRVSIVAARAIPRGTAIRRDMLTLQAPGTGLPARFLPIVEGHRVLYDIPEGAIVTLGLVEP